MALTAPLLAGAAAASAAPAPVTGTLDLAAGADATFTPGAPAAAGGAMAAVGDVNADGITDVAVAYRKATRLGRENAGVVSVVFGRSGGVGPTVRLGELGDGGFEIVGSGPNVHLGQVVAGAGDVNADGRADILIGRPAAGRTGLRGEGVAYVVFGRNDSTRVDLKNLGTAGFRIYGGAPGHNAGTALGAVGDLDGDGRPEIVVGAPGASPGGRAAAGRVMIVLSSRRVSFVDLATVGTGALEIDGAAAGDGAGSAVAGLPDVNGDGRPDLAIGAKKAVQGNGSVAIVHLPAPDAAPVDLAALAPGQGATLAGPAGAAAGSALASVGDLDGDGVGDLAVGAPLASPQARVRAGAVYLVPGSADGSGSLDTRGPWLVGARGSDRLGSSLDAGAPPGAAVAAPAHAVAVGAPISNLKDPTNGPLGRPEAGAAYVVFPAAARGLIDIALPPPGAVERLVGPTEAHAGAAVAVVRDAAATSVLVGASTPPQDAAAWLVRDVRAPALPGRQGEGCALTTNLEVIIDDSDSMNTNDPQLLGRQALDLLLTKPGNANRITGAVEFGSRARQIFPPLPAPGSSSGTRHDAVAWLMDEHIRHDAGKTNFAAAFLAARGQNPDATARIFITDGFASREGVPPFDASLAQGPPTYVIGLGRVRVRGADRRLTEIADSTGGEYFPRVDDKELAGVVDTIDAVGLCGLTALPTTASRAGSPAPQVGDGTTPTIDNGVQGALPEGIKVNRDRPAARFTTALRRKPSVVDLTLTWDNTSGDFVVSSLVIVGGKRPVRVPADKVRRALAGRTVKAGPLTLLGSRGESYATLRVAGLRRATAGRSRAHAAQTKGGYLANLSGRWKPGKKPKKKNKPSGRSSARSAASSQSARVSLSAYRRR